MKKDPRVYMAQILERIDRILTFTAEGRDAFLESQLLQDAASLQEKMSHDFVAYNAVLLPH